MSDGSVREAIESGARREDEIAERCGAARHCGGCLPELRRVLDEHRGALTTASS